MPGPALAQYGMQQPMMQPDAADDAPRWLPAVAAATGGTATRYMPGPICAVHMPQPYMQQSYMAAPYRDAAPYMHAALHAAGLYAAALRAAAAYMPTL